MFIDAPVPYRERERAAQFAATSKNLHSPHPSMWDGGCSLLKAVLVTVAIPVFTTQLEKSRESTDMANIRSAYAECMAAYLEDNGEHKATVDLKSNTTDWKNADDAEIAGVSAKTVIGSDSAKKTSIEVKVTDTGVITIGSQTATSSLLDS